MTCMLLLLDYIPRFLSGLPNRFDHRINHSLDFAHVSLVPVSLNIQSGNIKSG